MRKNTAPTKAGNETTKVVNATCMPPVVRVTANPRTVSEKDKKIAIIHSGLWPRLGIEENGMVRQHILSGGAVS